MVSPLTMSSSTLIETVNINLDDFSDTFLTCSTCLHIFDESERRAKLLSCSHSVCLSCLEQLAALPQNVGRSLVRCPMCREECIIPSGGVSYLPASFLINQLRDVLLRQRRDVVPSCSLHPQDGLLYCESCDHVFCPNCDKVNKKCSGEQHTVIAFSLALKRMSEIAQYRTQSRIVALKNATTNVNTEISLLDQNVDKIVDQINATFQEVSHVIESRRRQLIEMVRVRRDEKRKVLRDQLEAIQDEKKSLEKELESCSVPVRDVARRAKKISSDGRLLDPKENAFLRLNTDSSQLIEQVEQALNGYGTLSASTTFPPECTVEETTRACVHTNTLIVLRTADVEGKRRNSGGDPVTATLTYNGRERRDGDEHDDQLNPPVSVSDMGDGTYHIVFRVNSAGEYTLDVSIFGRPVRNSPLTIRVSSHQTMLWEAKADFNQPVRVAVAQPNNTFYILDTGNNRVRVLKSSGEVQRDISAACLEGGSAVGMALLPESSIALLNWKTRSLSIINAQAQPVKSIVFSEFQYPIDLAVDERGRFLVADTLKIFVLDSSLRPVFSFPANDANQHQTITCVAVGIDDDILVGTTSSLLLFDGGGRLQRKIAISPPETTTKSTVTCVATCPLSSRVVCGVVDSRTNRAELSVSSYKGDFLFRIDSKGGRLRRPSGLALSPEGHVFCVDHPTNSLRMYKFR
ncbi:nhl-3 [Pristionchus pacificus]|uniref:Nhl-3 n=1 Tax=Pristionchus pacificus TaxID=54126 RepID=A0A2A6D3C3_PRIPA|nr:nhl-3 [Pristionchus pacificus]|eukprot:PDM84899.1 nhl-3 [Pristionchus pacificus]